MDIRQLRYFVAIVEEGSISRASVRLSIAQPALSFHLRNMETELDAALLFRGPRGVIPTEAGQTLLRHARRIIDQFAWAEEEIRGQTSEPTGEVRLGLPGTVSQTLSVPLISAAFTVYPKVKLKIADAMSGFITEWLRQDRIDLGVLYSPHPAREFASRAILREELCVIGPMSAAALARVPSGSQIGMQALFRLPLILPSAPHGLRELLEQKAREHGLAIKTRIDIESYSNIKQLVAKGLGFSVLPVKAVADDVSAGRLRMWSVADAGLVRDLYLVARSDRPLATATRVIHALCQEVLAELVDSREWQGAKLIPTGQLA